MKHILYIPSGKYVVFPEGTVINDKHRFSAEELIEYYEGNCEDSVRYFHSYEDLIKGLCLYKEEWNQDVYEWAEIDTNKPLYECEFEVVDV